MATIRQNRHLAAPFSRYCQSISIILLSISCSSVDKQIEEMGHIVIQVEQADVLPVATLENIDGAQYQVSELYGDSVLFLVSGERPNEISVFNIQDNRLRRITVKNVKLKDRISGLSVRNTCDILFCQHDPPQIFETDSAGNITHTWGNKDLRVEKRQDMQIQGNDFSFYTFLSSFSPKIADDTLYIGIDAYGRYSNDSRINRIGVYDLNRGTWIKFICNDREIGFKREKRKSFSYDLEQPYICLADDILVISYPMRHNGYVFDIKNNFSYCGSFDASSSIHASFPNPKKNRFWDSCQKTWDFRRTTPYYGPIMFHKGTGLYSRLVYHAQQLYNDSGEFDSQRTISLVVFDSELNTVAEYQFEKGMVGVNSCWPTRTGILFSPSLINGGDINLFKFDFQ